MIPAFLKHDDIQYCRQHLGTNEQTGKSNIRMCTSRLAYFECILSYRHLKGFSEIFVLKFSLNWVPRIFHCVHLVIQKKSQCIGEEKNLTKHNRFRFCPSCKKKKVIPRILDIVSKQGASLKKPFERGHQLENDTK